jgi:hypothetical protein
MNKIKATIHLYIQYNQVTEKKRGLLSNYIKLRRLYLWKCVFYTAMNDIDELSLIDLYDEYMHP